MIENKKEQRTWTTDDKNGHNVKSPPNGTDPKIIIPKIEEIPIIKT